MKTRLFAIAILVSAVSSGNAGIVWDNNLVTNGYNGRAISPPAFPNMRAVDDIRVGSWTWRLQFFKMNILEDSTFQPGNEMDVYVYNDDGGAPGTLHTYFSDRRLTRRQTGWSYFGRADWVYEVNVLGLHLSGPATYWIGARNANAGGSGTNYWMTSDGGPDGYNTSAGFFSLDGGNTWSPEDRYWQRAFEVWVEVPEPATLAAIGAGLAALAARRRRRWAASLPSLRRSSR